MHVAGGPAGTVISHAPAPAEATVVTSIQTLLALISGALPAKAALGAKRITVTGDATALAELPQFFDVRARPSEDEGAGAGRTRR